MNTLNEPQVAQALDRLFIDAGKTTALMQERLGAVPPEERRARMADPRADYRAFYHQMKEVHMPVSRETGRLLYQLVRVSRASAIIEFGTSFGISTLHLAAGLRDNGGGALIGTDLEPTKIAQAKATLAAAGLSDLVEIREGDALETLRERLPTGIDLVLFDGHKPLYARVLELLAPRLHAGSVLVADNAGASPEYLAAVRGPGYVSVPFAEDVELSIKT